ncbi:voltage-dependent calcium channel gamma-2 subunit [Biomphalaria glabrata]|uniref:Uncharacterized protein LOC106065817 n=1 Tax=Biomphalaria glabrata TaxID=6526 RepID=A0A9U8EAJ6_BIOGL|nr:uncharacterized protein LOC106065817 [Biomphalaria glabrata]
MDISNNFKAARPLVKVVVILLVIAQVCNWLAFCTTSWYVHLDNNVYIGLWRSCSLTSCNPRDGIPVAFVMAVQAFAIFGFVSINLSFWLVLLYTFSSKYRLSSPTYRLAAGLLLCAVVSWLISVVVFGTNVCINSGQYNGKYVGCHYSYGLAVCAVVLSLTACILIFIDTRSVRTTVVSQRNVQVETTVTYSTTQHQQIR